MKHHFNTNPTYLSFRTLKSIHTTLKKVRRAAPVKKAQDAIENFFQERDVEGEVIQQSPRWMRATTYGLMGTAAFSVGWLALAKTDEVVTVSGKLEPLGSVQEIQMPMGGIASEILVKVTQALVINFFHSKMGLNTVGNFIHIEKVAIKEENSIVNLYPSSLPDLKK